MNRSIALFVAMAVLAAHSLSIHTDGTATLASPHDLAYVAFRIGQELAHEGTLTWFQGQDAFESYPSLAWVGFSGLIQRAYWLPINSTVQLFGALPRRAIDLRPGGGKRAKSPLPRNTRIHRTPVVPAEPDLPAQMVVPTTHPSPDGRLRSPQPERRSRCPTPPPT